MSKLNQRFVSNSRLCVLLALALAVVVTFPVQAKTKVRFAMWGTVEEVQTYQEIIEKFEADNPDIEVEFEYSSWGEYWDKVQIQMLGGIAPDVIRMSGAYLEPFALDGVLLSIQPFIEKDQFPIDTDEYFDVSGIFKVDGSYYGLPEGGDITALFYNEDLFNAAGLNYPSADWTWEDLRHAAKRLTVHDGNEVEQWGFHTFLNGSGQAGYLNFIMQAGGRALNDEKTMATVDTPEVHEALRFLQDMILGDGSAAPPDAGDHMAMFRAGQTAMLTAVVPFWTTFFEDASFDWDIAPLPMGKQRASTYNFCGFSMTSTTQESEAGWRLMKYFAGPEGQRILARNRQMLPPLRSVAVSDEFVDPTQRPYRLREVIEVTGPHIYDLQFTLNWWEWTEVLGNEVIEVMRGGKPVETAMKQATDIINQYLSNR